MKVAIIEDSRTYQKILNEIIERTTKWEVDFFSDASHFGRDADLKEYSIIIADFYLPGINGRDLIKTLSKKTRAEFALMSSRKKWVSDDDLNDEKISTIIDKTVTGNVIDALKYLDAKKRINDCMETEEKNMEEINSITNGNNKKI